MVEGTVHRVTFKSESGYTVLKVNAVHVSGKPADAVARSVAPSSARKGGATHKLSSLHLSCVLIPQAACTIGSCVARRGCENTPAFGPMTDNPFL